MHIYKKTLLTAAVLAVWGGEALALLGDASSRALGLSQAYTALARGPESVFWNPANLALSDSPKFSWYLLGARVSLIAENNSFSVKTYNDNFTDTEHFISDEDKRDLLADVPGSGLRLNTEVEPALALGIPVNGGIAFPLPGGISAAVAVALGGGIEGEMPKDMVELLLFGNEFEQDRLARGVNGGYDIAEWEGSAWTLGSVTLAGAKAWMPGALAPYLKEFTTGLSLKFVGGVYGEILRSDGGFVVRRRGAELNAYAMTQNAGGTGFGIDFGAAGTTKDGRTTFSVAMLNLLDTYSWSIDARQDSLFATAQDLRITRVFDDDVDNIEDVLDNEDVDGDGDVDFHKKVGKGDISRSLPALLRVGASHQLRPRILVAGNWSQAFSEGFGYQTTPRLSGAVEYRLTDWLPTRFGLSVGGRRGSSTSVGFGFGPFDFSKLRLRLLDVAFATRSGFFPGISKGSALSVMFFRLSARSSD